MAEQNWQCPYCGHHQVLLAAREFGGSKAIYHKGSEWGPAALTIVSNVCANEQCKKMTLLVQLWARVDKGPGHHGEYELKRPLADPWQLLPESSAKPQPDYIPQPIRDDYFEACRIRDLSAKASATLSRRCLQGMIRDFCGISRSRLIDEINALRTAVEEGKAPAGVQPDTIDAIDHVRSIGNIGAHMEADINVIVDVDRDEAQKLIELIEVLFEEWYVARHVRRERLKAIGAVAAEKKSAKMPKSAPS